MTEPKIITKKLSKEELKNIVVEYTSLINIKPAFGHRNMEIKDKVLKEKIHLIIEKLLLSDNEKLDV